MIAQSSIEALKTRLDIVDTVGGYIELKKKGVNFTANCPFHAEKTGSFVVSPKKNIYHCFGCNAGGDSISFVMNYENLSYTEAIQTLADKNGVEIEHTGVQEKKLDTSVMKRMNDYFVSLRSPDLIDYLHVRGLSDESIQKWEIGIAPSSMQSVKYANEHILDKEALIALGVMAEKEGRMYCRFANRLMLPIYGNGDHIIGFNGRVLENGEPKYLNSPQTKLFNKSSVFFGFNKARKSIYDKGEVIITEGCFDVILLHQAGFTHTVATLGTALGKEHLGKLTQSDARVILAYDGDKAGVGAAFKAASLLGVEGFLGGVVLFPNGKDPADMIRDGLGEEVKRLLSTPTSFIPFVLETTIKGFDTSNPVAKSKALKACMDYVKTLPSILQDEYHLWLSKVLSIDIKHIVPQGNKPPAPLIDKEAKEDMGELSILKAMALESDDVTNTVLSYIDDECFLTHQPLFEALGAGDENIVRSLACSLDIPSLDEDQLKHALSMLLIRRFTIHLKELSTSSLSHKMKRIYTTSQYLIELRNGKLVKWRRV